MNTLQNILVFITVGIAAGYVIKKFFIPKRFLASKKSKEKACGSNDCACH